MGLDQFEINLNTEVHSSDTQGELQNQYSPFNNLKSSEGKLESLSLNPEIVKLDITAPVDINITPSYDDSVDLTIIDGKNPPKLVNSRFSLLNSTEYIINDRKGDLDTNIYEESKFTEQASLIKFSNNIINVEYNGLSQGGSLPVGNYTFFFKLEDADGNQTDFVCESGHIVCHMGQINDPKSIRGGLLDENSEKSINMSLNNIDLGFDYVKVYYTRSTATVDGNKIDKTYIIEDKFRIVNIKDGKIPLKITGWEKHTEIDSSEINIQYTTFDSVKTQATAQNINFMGGIDNDYEYFKELERLSLYIYPTISTSEKVGKLNLNYNSISSINENEYYNTQNIYYRLGFWNNEIYRLGIVYVLNNYTLSPVFNIRGVKELTSSSTRVLDDELTIGDDYSINNTDDNSKGVFKIKYVQSDDTLDYNVPIGIKINFDIKAELKDLVKGYFIVRQKRIPTILAQGIGIATSSKVGIPTIKTQNINPYVFNTFLKENKLESDYFHLNESVGNNIYINKNALLCPEATINSPLYNNYFNSSEFKLQPYLRCKNDSFIQSAAQTYYLDTLFKNPSTPIQPLVSTLTLVETGTELTGDESYKYSTRAGNPEIAHKHTDPVYGDVEDPTSDSSISDETWSTSATKVRGVFNSFVGCNNTNIEQTTYYNIYNKDYDFDLYWKDYFKLRYNDSSAFSAISDRIDINTITDSDKGVVCYRGDCYINTYTQRMQWGFNDPDLPTNKRIIDPYTWYKNYRVRKSDIQVVSLGNATVPQTISRQIRYNHIGTDSILVDAMTKLGVPNIMKAGWVVNINGYSYNILEGDTTETFKLQGDTSKLTPLDYYNFELVTSDLLTYRKILPLFTYRGVVTQGGATNDEQCTVEGITTPEEKKFKKFSELNGLFGTDKINRPDVNAVPCGYWVTFPICSNMNLAMRDLDPAYPAEEALHKKKRGFYPLQPKDVRNSLPESTVINLNISKTSSEKAYFEIPDVPFIRTNFTNRIYYSDILQQSTFKNGNRIFRASDYRDYTMEYGGLTKLIEWEGALVGVMEHGIILIPVKERAMMNNQMGDNIYINTNNVLPENPHVISQTFGSIFAESVCKTPTYIYGVDTVAKKIWRFSKGSELELISDLKVQKFLNDKMDIKESDKGSIIQTKFVKTHYNAFKRDVIFTFKNGNNEWSLCWNELTGKWVTEYSWIPSFSENINNVFYTFANTPDSNSPIYYNLWKHGFAESNYKTTTDQTGFDYKLDFKLSDSLGSSEKIYPTKWYNKQEKFSFEFVVIGIQGIQKIFNNLKIISNRVKPESFTYEIVGEGYDWVDLKDDILKINEDNFPLTTLEPAYLSYLQTNTDIYKLPFIDIYNSPLSISNDYRTGENFVKFIQQGLDIKKVGRLKGNMQYVEDCWDVQIAPLSFKYTYLKNGILTKSKTNEMKIRDKYIKIKIEYSGEELAIITALKTLFTVSFA